MRFDPSARDQRGGLQPLDDLLGTAIRVGLIGEPTVCDLAGGYEPYAEGQAPQYILLGR